MNTQIANKIDLVRNSFPSVFSKDDVVKLLEDLSNETASDDVQESVQDARILIDEEMDELASRISNKLCRMGTGLIEDYELSISGREIEIDDVTIDESNIEYEVKEIIEKYINELKAELKNING